MAIPIYIDLRIPSTWQTCFPGGSDGKASVYNPGDQGSIPRLERSPGEGNGNPLQHYCLENLMDKGAWYATVHGVAKTRTWLSDSSSLILDRNFSVFLFLIMTSLMVSFIFISAFSMGGRMTLICSSLIVQNIWEYVCFFHIAYQPKENLAGSCLCPVAIRCSEWKGILIFSPGQDCNFYASSKA